MTMPLKCHIYATYANYVIFRYETSTSVQQCDQKNWYTSISHYWYMPLNKYAFHIPNVSHYTVTVVYTHTPLLLQISKKYNQPQQLLHTLLSNMFEKQIGISNATYIWYMKISSCAHMRNYVSTYTSYEFTAIKNVTRSTSIYTYHITGICPWKNMPAISQLYVPLHW